MIEDLPEKAREEIKRADHLVYVTLKYTRTCDVIKSIVKRLIVAFDYSFLELLECLKEKKKIRDIPVSSKERIDLVLKYFKEDIDAYIKLYELLRAIDIAEYSKKEEYRKHVTLIVHLGKKDLDVDIPVITGYFLQTKQFVNTINEYIFS